MKRLVLALLFAVAMLGAAPASLGADRCIVDGWPVPVSAVATTGTVQQVTLGAASTAGSAVVCFVDSRVFHVLSSAGIGLDTTKLGCIIFIR